MSRLKPHAPPRQREPRLEDRKWLKAVRTLPCVVTGCQAPYPIDIVPAHIRYGLGGGMGTKPPDNRVLPLRADLHQRQHDMGEVAFWRAYLGDDLLMRALIALAEKLHREWK